MRKLKNTLVGLFALLIIYSASYFFSLYQPQKPATQVLSAVSKVVLFQQPGSGHEPIIEAINKATSSIYLEVYLLSDKKIISALQQADSRGVDIKIILEKHPFGGGSINPKTKKILEESGIAVQWSNPEFALTHEKAMIIDSKLLFILNQNLTASAFVSNREYNILDSNPDDVKEAVNIFTADWQRTAFLPIDSHLIVSPVNSRTAITKLFEKATRQIDIEIESINDQKIIELLTEKAKTVKVRLITPTIDQIFSNRDALLSLSKAGAQTRTLKSPYIHAKLIIIDSNLAYIGSVNLSSQSMDNNRELGIIISEPDILLNLQTSFQKDWESSTQF